MPSGQRQVRVGVDAGVHVDVVSLWPLVLRRRSWYYDTVEMTLTWDLQVELPERDINVCR